MIKNIVAGVCTILAFWAMFYMYSLDKDVDKLQKIHEIIEQTKITVKSNKNIEVKKETKTVVKNKQNINNEMDEKLKALKNKAGNIAAFKTSALYKQKCSSCHGNIGEGIIGPKLIGKSETNLLSNLKDFKSGKKKNYVMYGLLNNLSDNDLIKLSKEIATFKDKLDKANK